jgi:hypothetical protein
MVIVPLGTFLHGNDIIFLISQKRFSYGRSKKSNFIHNPKEIIIKKYDLYFCLKFPLKEE